MGSSEGNEQEHASGPERPSRSPGSNLARLELDFPEDSGSLGGREAGGGFRHWRLRHFVGGKWSICSCKAIEKRAGSQALLFPRFEPGQVRTRLSRRLWVPGWEGGWGGVPPLAPSAFCRREMVNLFL